MPMLNRTYEARGWAARQPDPALAVKLDAWTMWAGVFADPLSWPDLMQPKKGPASRPAGPFACGSAIRSPL